MDTFTVLILLNYALVAYLTLLWGSLDSITVKEILKEPALYHHLFKFKSQAFILAIFFPWIYCLGIYLSGLFTGIFLGIVPGKNEVSLSYDLLLNLYFATPLVIFGILFVRSTLLVHCSVCDGVGRLYNYNSYLDIDFHNEICFCCKGKKSIWKKSEIGKSHTLLQDNLLFEKDKHDKIQKLIKEQNKIEQKLQTTGVSSAIHQQANQLTEKVRKQIEFEQAAKNFYSTAVKKLMTLIYNKHLAEYILGKTKEFDAIEEQNVATYADTEAKKYQLSDTEIVDKIEALVQEIALNQNLTIVAELQKELEKSTKDLEVK